MNKQERRTKQFHKYKKRLARRVANMDWYITRDGEWMHKPKVVDVIKDNGYFEFKNSSVLCSCSMCSDDHYRRYLKKKEDERILKDYFDEIADI